MTQPTDKPGPGDSTPNFDWVHEQGTEKTRTWQPPSGSDSATTLLPPGAGPGHASDERTELP